MTLRARTNESSNPQTPICLQALLSALKRRVAELEEELSVLNASGGAKAGIGTEEGGAPPPLPLPLSTFLAQLEPHELEARVRYVSSGLSTGSSSVLFPAAAWVLTISHVCLHIPNERRQEDFLVAAAKVSPSVSADELRHYERLRVQFGSLSAAAAPPPPEARGNGGAAGDGGNGGGGGEGSLAKAAVRSKDEGAMEEVWSSLGQGQEG